MTQRVLLVDGNEAAALSAHKTNEVIAIYPITPSSNMGEHADAWSAKGRTNIWGTVPEVIEMQSEGGAAGAVHGSLQAGSLTTTFTASQGLLLMIPNMYKIAGELTPTVFHVAARAVATHALSIFGDHSDVMATRQCGWAQLCSGSIQEVHDFALIAQAATLKARVPFLHFFDGFRSSHELNKIYELDDDTIRAMIDDDDVRAMRERALSPDHPVLRGTAQNPDVFFQAREAINPYYQNIPGIFKEVLQQFGELTGRHYAPFEYVGADDAEHVIVMMGSGIGAAEEAVNRMVSEGEKVGMVKVRLYRPFNAADLLSVIPASVKRIAALDRTKEPGAEGEPLYLDVVAALARQWARSKQTELPQVFGGRYGLGSKEFAPSMVKGVFDELGSKEPRHGFTVGIVDDVSHTSVDYDPDWSTEPDDVRRCVFFGLGADGTVGANKNSSKIIGESTDLYSQGYFVYDSKKSGSTTISHLRFGPRPINSTYLIRKAQFVACHQFVFTEKMEMLDLAVDGATFLLNSPYGPDEVWEHLPGKLQQEIVDKKLKFYVIDAGTVAEKAKMGTRINTVMQACFFALSEVLPRDQAIDEIKKAIEKTYGARGEVVVQRNWDAVDMAVDNLHEVKVPETITGEVRELVPDMPEQAPDFVKKVTSIMMAGKGDLLPVSAMPVDGTFPTATAQWEKRSIAREIPVWDDDICIQCGLCAFVCPHTTIRTKVYEPAVLDGAPDSFQSMDYKTKEYPGQKMTVQVAPDDCTGCGVCVDVCPAFSKSDRSHKAINMEPQLDHLERERVNWDFFLDIEETDRKTARLDTVKGSQMLEPLFEFSGACAGCGETPYIKLLTQLFGDRILIANATGCSSIYGGNLPTTPYAVNDDGRGPAWSNSLFEDNAEFGLGMRLSLESHMELAVHLLKKMAGDLGEKTVQGILDAEQNDETDIEAQRARIAGVKDKLSKMDSEDARNLLKVIDALANKSVWIVGGDGWAYDIGFGGVDHVLASGRNVNLLILDTEVYSNTGGQASKSTPRAAVAKFAAGGKPGAKKDFGMIAMSYGNVYVGQIALGANPKQTIKTFLEAESWPGPSVIIAYSQCIAHGIDMTTGMTHQKEAVNSGYWPLYRFDPRHSETDHHPFQLDSKKPKIPYTDFATKEARFAMLERIDSEAFHRLTAIAQEEIDERWRLYEQMASVERTVPGMTGVETVEPEDAGNGSGDANDQ
ncbi:MAG TPA: pyruvate:ferredoxin (flavodoxin) oxidoreductase [Candidatus Krumholzibacteria bacterium]|nr:pyruvate:ferredoxin (flavodoxin) oxidoreductase [Candidatus Krumholzibacteria bacterium]